LYLRARVCSLLGSCVALCLLLRCRLCLVLLGVAPFRSAPLGVLRPKPPWGRAWSQIWFFFLIRFGVFPVLKHFFDALEKQSFRKLKRKKYSINEFYLNHYCFVTRYDIVFETLVHAVNELYRLGRKQNQPETG
jgi:hypothetical protein